jgi:CheY-like chemotaxis protein
MSTPNDANNNIQDPGRLSVLRDIGLLDSPPEECFDRLTRLAAKTLDVPIALICLAHEKRDIYKSVVGLPTASHHRGALGETLCWQDSLVAIEDMRAHERHKDDAMVNSLGIRAYLAAPLNVRGTWIGSFTVIDIQPRRWSATDREVVEQLARSTAQEIELRITLHEAEALRTQPASAGETTAGRVLISDDDAAMRRLIARTLADDGYQIEEARDGEETLDILQDKDVDLLILDLVMPNVSGWDVLERRVKDEHLRKMPVIVVSARRGPDVARAVAFGIYGLVPKPFDPSDLRDLVRTCFLERRSEARAS